MCGASLDASAKSEEDDSTSKKSGRVRQRTMSTKSDGEIAQVREQVRTAMNITESESAQGENDRTMSEDDPLSAYLEEVETDQVEPLDYHTPPAEMPDSAVQNEQATPFEEKRSIAALKSQRMEERMSGSSAPQAKIKPETAYVRTPESKSQAGMETGGRARGKGELQSFGKPKGEIPLQSVSEQPVVVTTPVEHVSTSEPVGEKKGPDIKPEPSPPKAAETTAASVESSAQTGSAGRTPVPGFGQVEARMTKPTKMRGRLFGWLVNYGDPDGSAVELREGKFFITRASLKNNDMLIDHESISTPHAMVVVDSEHGLRIQDLMSERGIFVRKRGADTYRREEDVMVVENGDWVRLGDVEFLVSLVPYVGVK